MVSPLELFEFAYFPPIFANAPSFPKIPIGFTDVKFQFAGWGEAPPGLWFLEGWNEYLLEGISSIVFEPPNSRAPDHSTETKNQRRCPFRFGANITGHSFAKR